MTPLTVYTYNSAGQLETETDPFTSDTLTNIYFNHLRVGLGLEQPTGSWTNGFGYDAAKRLTNVTSPAGVFGYTYDPVRLMKPSVITLPTGSYITNTYDPVARVLSTLLADSSHTTLDAAEYGYNVGGQRTTFTNTAGTYVEYMYDPLGQVTVATSSASGQSRGYLYDAAWNLQHLTNNGSVSSYTVNGLNELTVAAQSTNSFDTNGNVTSSIGSLAGAFYEYDDENRLASAVTGAGDKTKATTFVYDGLGRLRELLLWATNDSGGQLPISGSWTLTGGTNYIYDGKRVIEERDTNNNPVTVYTWGDDLRGSLEGAAVVSVACWRALPATAVVVSPATPITMRMATATSHI